MELRGRLVVVTGASSGLGRAIAVRLVGEGADVLLVARRADRLDELASTLNAARADSAYAFATDLSDPQAARRIVDEAARLASNRAAGLVNCAGRTWYGASADMAAGDPRSIVELNVCATIDLTLAFSRAFVMSDSSAIDRPAVLTITSLAAYLPVPYQSVYAATKHALRGFLESLRFELGRDAVLSMCAPGGVRTEMTEGAGLIARFEKDGRHRPAIFAEPDAVARIAIAGWKRERALIVPGFSGKVAVAAGRWLPTSLLGRIAARFYG